jgi:hypothetical protein
MILVDRILNKTWIFKKIFDDLTTSLFLIISSQSCDKLCDLESQSFFLGFQMKSSFYFEKMTPISRPIYFSSKTWVVESMRSQHQQCSPKFSMESETWGSVHRELFFLGMVRIGCVPPFESVLSWGRFFPILPDSTRFYRFKKEHLPVYVT